MGIAPAGSPYDCGSRALAQSHAGRLLLLSVIDFSLPSVYLLAYCADVLFTTETYSRSIYFV